MWIEWHESLPHTKLQKWISQGWWNWPPPKSHIEASRFLSSFSVISRCSVFEHIIIVNECLYPLLRPEESEWANPWFVALHLRCWSKSSSFNFLAYTTGSKWVHACIYTKRTNKYILLGYCVVTKPWESHY